MGENQETTTNTKSLSHSNVLFCLNDWLWKRRTFYGY